ncbi:MAG TPA: 2Fe-2S iron-sulfur cluster-binding protein [Holophagaceae bacterium]|nr:2Fe-2S iron-sulfur cluster-binding protein [Holophagaceae bacterium]
MARTRSGDVELSGSGTLMAQALAAGLPVASSCSGRGACGRCLVSILQGEAALTEVAPHEREVLHRNGAATGTRLACQTRLLSRDVPVALTTGYW